MTGVNLKVLTVSLSDTVIVNVSSWCVIYNLCVAESICLSTLELMEAFLHVSSPSLELIVIFKLTVFTSLF